MKLVIIGGDAAGMSAASRTKRLDPAAEVVVIEQTRDVSYSACGMPYNIADPARLMDDLIVRPVEEFQQKMGIQVMTGHRVQSIDPLERMVSAVGPEGKEIDVPYDNLLIATGARPIIPDLPGFDLPGVLALKSLSQGRAIKDYLNTHAVKQVAIIGMGYIGLEMCEAFSNLGLAVTMIKPNPDLLPWMPREMAATVAQELKDNYIRIDAGNTIQAIESTKGRLKVRGDRDAHQADMVLVAVGVRPNSELAANAGLALGPAGAVAVDHGLRTSDQSIFAAGDCADAFHVVTGEKTWIPLALRANRAGWAVADQVCGNGTMLPGIAGTTVFKVFDLEVARTGLNKKEARRAGFEPVEVTITTRSRAHAHPGSTSIQVHMVADQKSGRLLGAQMVGKEGAAHRINAAAVALHGQMTVAQFLQCDLSYAPPFGPVWDPLLTAANQLIKKL